MSESLTEYNAIIDFIKEMKQNLDNYSSEIALEKDFYKSISLVWEDLIDLRKQDLTNMYEVQKYLIHSVCSIHEDERSIINENVLKENININQAKNRLVDGNRAYNIYSFKEKGWEYYLIGDIHSDNISLDRILKKTDFFKRIFNGDNIRVIFLGDYVDRGKAHLKTIQYILTLKYLFPNNIYLQKGNHDGGSFEDGEVKMWVRMPDKDLSEDWFLYYLYELASLNPTLKIDIIHNCLRFFNSLSNISFISLEDKNIFLTHGGIPRPIKDETGYFDYIKSISDLTNDNIKDNINKTITNNMMWSDPTVSEDNLNEDKGRFRFTEEQFEDFRGLIGFDILVRGHQVQEMGYKNFFQDKLINIFSSGTIIHNGENINLETAYSKVSPKIIYIDLKGGLKIIDLNKNS